MAIVTEIKATKKVVTQISKIEVAKKKKLRVAAYARVSTKLEEQENSYELQINEYTKRINENPDWVFAGMYSDKGISGTSTKNREGFKKMIYEAIHEHKIDLILTKSISRFGRNVSDILQACQQLRDEGIEIRFEKEHLNNMDGSMDFVLTVMCGIAQEESRSISENLTWSIRNRYKQGIHRLNTNQLYGYGRDEKDNIIINDAEADIVRRIYAAFLAGLTTWDIAKELNNNKIMTASNKKWTYSNVRAILTNEKYCGDAILQKTFTVNYLTHKRKKNNGEVPSYYVSNDHIGIVSKDDFDKVQLLLEAYTKTKETKTSTNLPLCNLVYCANCGRVMKRVPGGDKRNKLWCNFNTDSGKCSLGYTDYDDVEDALLSTIEKMINSKSVVKEINEIIANCDEYSFVKAKLESLKKEIAELVKNIDKLIDMKIKSNQLTESDFKKKYDSLNKELEEKQKLFDELEEEYKSKTSSSTLFKISVENLYKGEKLVSSNHLFRRLFKVVLYSDKTIYPILNTPATATLSIKEIIKTYTKQKTLISDEIVFSSRRSLKVEVKSYGN